MAGGIVIAVLLVLALIGAGELLIRGVEQSLGAALTQERAHGELGDWPALPPSNDLRRLRENGAL